MRTALTGIAASSLLAVLAAAEPIFTLVEQPASRRVIEGSSVQFSIAWTSAEPPVIQWRKDGLPLPGQVNPTLVLGSTMAADAGTYDAVLSRASSPEVIEIASQPAVLGVLPAPDRLWRPLTFEDIAPSRATVDAAGSNLLWNWNTFSLAYDIADGRLIGALPRTSTSSGSVDSGFSIGTASRWSSPPVRLPGGGYLVPALVGEVSKVIRVTESGLLDDSFSSPSFSHPIRFLTRQTDGKVLLTFDIAPLSETPPPNTVVVPRYSMHRLLETGALDPSFTPATFSNVPFSAPQFDAQGRILVGGNFTHVNGIARQSVARFSANGVLDTTFPSGLPAGFAGALTRQILVQSTGKIVAVGRFRYTGRGSQADPVIAIRFLESGAFDGSFANPLVSESAHPQDSFLFPRAGVLLPSDGFVTAGLTVMRFSSEGVPDLSFGSPRFGIEAFWIERLPDGRFIVPRVDTVRVGNITHFTGAGGSAMLTSEGFVDTGFQPAGWGESAYPTSGAVLENGTLAAGGVFTRHGSRQLPLRTALLSPGFQPLAAQPVTPAGTSESTTFRESSTVASLPGAGVYFQLWVDGTRTARLHRYFADGTVDTSFNAPTTFAPGFSLSILDRIFPLTDGGVLVAQGGVPVVEQLNYNAGALPPPNVARLAANGSVTATFLPDSYEITRDANQIITNIRVREQLVLAVDPSTGSSLVARVDNSGAVSVFKLDGNGVEIPGFVSPVLATTTVINAFTGEITDPVTATTDSYPFQLLQLENRLRTGFLHPNGTAYVGGVFTIPGVPAGLVRLLPTGGLDPSFSGAGGGWQNGSIANPLVLSLAMSQDGRLYFAGRFDTWNGFPRAGIARLSPGGAFDETWSASSQLIQDYPFVSAKLVAMPAGLHVFGTVGPTSEVFPRGYAFIPYATAPALGTGTPAAVTQPEGSTLTLSFPVSGDPAPTLSWFKNGTPIDGALSPSLDLGTLNVGSSGDYRLVATNSAGSVEANVRLTVTQSFASWAAANAAPGQPALLPEADSDGDLISNLLEAALGTNPRDPRSASSTGLGSTLSGPVFRYTTSRTLSPITYRVGVSNTLGTWTTLSTPSTLESETATTQTWTVPLPALVSGRSFIRLEVVLPP